MHKRNPKKLELHRESLCGLDLGAVRGAAPTNVPTCAATICTMQAACGPTHALTCICNTTTTA